MTKLDPIQIQRLSFDEETNAVKVLLTATDIAVQLDSDDGDSVLSIKKMEVIEAKADQEIDCSKASKMNVICDEAVECLMLILNKEISMGAILGIKEICCPKIKVKKDCIIILQS